MPTGSYDSSVTTLLVNATQPLTITVYDSSVATSLVNATQPLTIYVDNYLATVQSSPPPPSPIVSTLSSVIVGVINYPTVIIDSKNTTSPNVFIIG